MKMLRLLSGEIKKYKVLKKYTKDNKKYFSFYLNIYIIDL